MQTLESVVGKPYLVTQHNSLVRARYNYTHREIKVTRLITSKVDPFKDYVPGSGLVVEVEPKEAQAIFAAEGTTYNSVWRDFRNTIASLNKKPIHIDTPNIEGDIYWTQSCIRDKKTGRYRVRLTEDITPLVAALNGGNFTSVPLTLYSEFKSKYLCRLYEILYSYRSMRGGRMKFPQWTTLAEQTGWDSKKYGHFKNRVLSEANKLFPERTPLSFTLEEIKRPGSRAVEGLVFTITTQNPRKQSADSLFPEMSGNHDQAIKEIRHQLMCWSVDEIVMEKLISNPFGYIKDDDLRQKVEKQYSSKIDYLWEKMEYVANSRDVKNEAAYLVKAIQNNYTSKQQKKEKESGSKKQFREQQSADIATLEQQIASVRSQSIAIRREIIHQMFSEDQELMEKIFDEVTQKDNTKRFIKDLSDPKALYQNNQLFQAMVISHMQEQHPQEFQEVNNDEAKQVLTLGNQIIAVKNRTSPTP